MTSAAPSPQPTGRKLCAVSVRKGGGLGPIFRDGPANAYIHSANRVSPLSRPSARAEIAAARPKIPV
jgi:hypothetical protein